MMPKQKGSKIFPVICFLFPFIFLSAQDVVITSVTSTPVTCGGGSDGTITVTITGGVPPYQYGLIQEFIYVETSSFTESTTYTFTGHEKYSSYLIIVRDSDPNTAHGFVSNYPIGGPDPISITNALATDISCNGAVNGTITVTASGEDGNYIFDLNGPVNASNTSGFFNGLPEGDYTVTVSHNGSCPSTDITPVLTITNPSPVFISVDNISPATCYSGFTGSIAITPSGGTPSGSGTGYTYFWTGPNGFTSTNEDIINIESGNYFVTVYDGNMCMADAGPLFVPEPPDITVVLDGSSDVSCNGGNNGSVAVTVSGGTPGYSYLWIGQYHGFMSTAEDPSNLIADTYELTITDSNGCSKIFPGFVTIDQPSAITISINAINDVTCFGGTDGSAFVTISGGIPGYSYLWSGSTSGYSSTDEDPFDMPADDYSLIVTDAEGCIEVFTDLLTITEPDRINVIVNGTTNVLCHGGSDGTANITVIGGTPEFTFLWTGNNTPYTSSMEDPTDLIADEYDLLITDANGCHRKFNKLISISEPAIISVTVNTVTDVICYGDATGAVEITPTGGMPLYSYEWSGPGGFTATSQNIYSLPAGNYSLSITDANGCTRDFINLATIGEPSEIISSFVLTDISCNGLSDGAIDASVSGGNPPYAFSWTGPLGYTAGTEDISGLLPGNYELTVTDNGGCIKVFPAQILVEPLLITASAVVVDSDCHGSDNGSVIITVSGGTPPYTFEWTGPGFFTSSDEDIFNLSPGNYSLTITDLNGCLGHFTDIAIVNEPSEIMVSASKTDISCHGLTDGIINITVSGGVPPYNFLWTGPGGFTSSQQNLSGLAAGTYNLTITDGNSCLVDFPGFETIIEPLPINTTLNSTTDVTCNGGSDGTIEISVTGGTPPLVFRWTNASGITVSAIEDPQSLPAGTYSLEINDLNGCSEIYPDFAVINEPSAISFSLSKTDIDCYGNGNGTITVTASGGISPYKYSREGNTEPAYQDDNTFTDLGPGTYTIWVRDANLCVTSDAISISEPGEIIILEESIGGEILCYGDATAQLSINSVTGGVMPYEYSINGGADFYLVNVFPGLPAGNYQTVVRDANGCESAGNLNIINQPDELKIDSYIQDDITTCYDSPEGHIIIAGTGGTGQLSYTLDGSMTNQTGEFQNLSAGSYALIIEDENSCMTDTLIEILSPPEIVVNHAAVLHITGCFGDATGSVSVTGTGGTGNILYSLNGDPFVMNGTFTDLTAGNYTVTLKDDNDCTTDTLLTINEPDPLLIVSETGSNIFCSGADDGSIEIEISGGTLPYSFTLNPGGLSNSTGIFSNLFAGDYTVAVDDSRGCGPVNSSVIGIIEPSPLIIDSLNYNGIICHGENNGEIHIYASGGTPPYEYTINNRNTFFDSGHFTGLGPANYEVYVTDMNGCEVSGGSYTFDDPPALTLSITVTDVTPCYGYTTGAISAIATGGSGVRTYSIDGTNFQLSGDFNDLPANSYTVYVRDENGCGLSESVNIDEPEQVTALIEKTDAVFGNLGTITISETSGGTMPYEYSINGTDGPFTTETHYESLDARVYHVIIRDFHGCTYEEMVEIFSVVPLNVIISKTDVTCYGFDNGSIEFFPQDAVGNVEYSVDNGETFYSTSLFENLAGNVTYHLVAKDEEGKVFSSPVVINEPDEISVFRNITPAECNVISETGAISVTVTGGTGPYSYFWSNGSTSRNLTGILAGNYTLTVTDENECTVTEDILVNSLITVHADAGKDTIICPGTSIQLNGRGGTGISWTPSIYLSNPKVYNPIATGITEEISYILTVTEELSPYGCYDMDTITISVFPTTGLYATGDTFILRGASVQLNAGGGPYESYLWEPSAGLDNPGIPDPVASPIISVRYYVTVINEYGCREMDSTYIEVIENITVYNVFSPNGDGKNDFFDIEHAYRFPDMIVEVYSRWGDLMFSSKGYTDDKRWDGTSRGKDAPVGTYYYVIIPFSGARPITGNVTIIR